MNLQETLDFLNAPHWKGKRPGLGRMEELLHKLGDPHLGQKYVHVAGTNGKGSVCAMLASILCAAGYRTGLYTSPHLLRYNERIAVNGEEVSDGQLACLAGRVRAAAETMADPPTTFELLTAMALLHFRQQKCDIAVLEVGLGGRLDATNAIGSPEVAIIASLALEHTEILGDTIEKIAFEKGGIIKSGCVAVSYDSAPQALSVLCALCESRCVPFRRIDMDCLRLKSRDWSGQRFDWEDLEGLFLPLLGEHQLHNACLALEAVSVLRERGWNISDEHIRKGLASTRWPARFEVLAQDPVTILDGAHNPQCAVALAKGLASHLPGQKATVLMGALRDKDWEAMASAVAPFAARFLCVSPDSERALPAGELAAHLRRKGLDAEVCESAADGIEKALTTGGPVVIFGSLYLAGGAKAAFFPVYRKWLRIRGIEARDSLSSAERERLSAKLVENLLALPEFLRAKTVLIYRATRGEARLDALLAAPEAQGKRFSYPLCVSKTEMLARVPRGEGGWKRGAYGIWEPVLEQSDPVLPEEIDLVICPCTAFDEACSRLGMGGGYYDRFLPRCVNARIAAAAFSCQQAKRIPAASWDVPMDLVVTEKAVYRRDGAKRDACRQATDAGWY